MSGVFRGTATVISTVCTEGFGDFEGGGPDDDIYSGDVGGDDGFNL